MDGGILKRIAKNSIAVLSEKLIEVSMGIVSVAILTRYFDVETFGVYVIITTFVGLLLAIGYGGMERIMIRDIAKNKNNLSEYLQTVKRARILLIVASTTLVVIFSYFLKLSGTESFIAIFLFTLSEIIALYGTTYMAVFKAFEKMEYNTLITFSSKVITLSGIIVVAYFRFGFLSAFIALMLGNILKTFFAISIYKRKFSNKPMPLSFSNANSNAKELLKESYIIAISAIFALASIRIGVFILKAFGTLRDVAFFQASNTILLQFQLISIAIVTALFPVISSQSNNTDKGQGLNIIFGKAVKFIFIISLPLIVITYFFSHELITLLYGDKYIDAVPAMKILIFSLVFTFLSSLFEVVLISERRQHLFTTGWGIAFFVNLLLNLFLVPQYGFIGSGIATVLSYMALCVSLCVFMLNYTEIKLNIGIFIKPSIACIAMVSYLYFFSSGGNALNVIDGLNILMALVLYGTALFLIKVFSVEEIMFIKNTLTFIKSDARKRSDIDERLIVKEKYL